MREILFKAKRKDNGRWETGYYEKKTEWHRLSEHGEYVKTEKHYICVNMVCSEDSYIDEIEVIPDTICQYTGLTDKNGNKIWENDVIQYIDEDLAVNGVVRFGRHEQIVMLELGFYVEWVSNEAECFKTDICYWVERRDIEVIDNIFDNHELLKGE